MVNSAFADGPAPATSPRQKYEKKESLTETPKILLKQCQRLETIIELVAVNSHPSHEELVAVLAPLATAGLKLAAAEFGRRQDIEPRDKKEILKGTGFAFTDLSNPDYVAQRRQAPENAVYN